MLTIQPTKTYHAVLSGTDVCRGTDGKTVLKVYYVDIIGRDEPERYEWDKCGMSKADFLSKLAGAEGIEGVGFITAFPHVMKAFRFAPENEIVLNVRAWHTADLEPLDLSRLDEYVEFACLAEAEIAADEYRFWAQAETVEGYLEQWCAYEGGRIVKNDKLQAYWQ